MLSCSVLLTLRDLLDCSPPGSSVQGISQARILDGVAISFSRGCPFFFFLILFYFPGAVLNPWIEPASPVSPALKADSSLAEPLRKPVSIKTDMSINGTE